MRGVGGAHQSIPADRLQREHTQPLWGSDLRPRCYTQHAAARISHRLYTLNLHSAARARVMHRDSIRPSARQAVTAFRTSRSESRPNVARGTRLERRRRQPLPSVPPHAAHPHPLECSVNWNNVGELKKATQFWQRCWIGGRGKVEFFRERTKYLLSVIISSPKYFYLTMIYHHGYMDFWRWAVAIIIGDRLCLSCDMKLWNISWRHTFFWFI